MFRVIVGFVLAVIVTRNAQGMAQPVVASIFLAFCIGAYVMYRFGSRDKASAVATAVAVATATATANAEAKAQAIAQSAVTLILGGNNGGAYADPIVVSDTQRSISSEVRQAIEQVTTKDFSLQGSSLADAVPIPVE